MTVRDRAAALVQGVVLGTVVGVLCGVSSAVFLRWLEEATRFRTEHETLVYALPLAGLLLGTVYEKLGAAIRAGNNLVIDTIHDGGPEIPLRMAPMVLLGTVATHLFGGSAGREGTAVQMGASLADFVAHRWKVPGHVRRQCVCAGVAGGFGAVFGTPVAGTVFGLEFVVLGRLEYGALVPALVASVVGDLTTRGLGVVHTAYPAAPHVALTPLLLLKWLVLAGAVALVAVVFIELMHAIRKHGERWVPRLPVRMFLGGLTVVALWKLSGTSDHLGLGLPLLERAFADAELPWSAFALKLLFTAVTVGSGFLGGEVTPLFVVGATLGSVLAGVLGIPLELAAGVGMAAMFAAASNTPLALSIMAVELMGAHAFPHVVVVCVVAYLLSGQRSIYPAQRVVLGKGGEGRAGQVVRLRDLDAAAHGHPKAPPPPGV